MKPQEHIDIIEGYVENDKFHLAIAHLNGNPKARSIPGVYRVIHGKLEEMHDQWPGSRAGAAIRTKYRDLAVLHTMVAPNLPIFEYPDGVPMSKPVAADEEEARAFEQHELEHQESAVVICFTGENAKIHATQFANMLKHEHFIEDRLDSLGLTLKTVRVHDCRQHPIR